MKVPKKRVNRTTTLLIVLLLAFASCGLLGGAAFWVGTNLDAKARGLKFNLAEAEARGMLTRPDELVREVPLDQDARPELKLGYEEWRKLSDEERTRVFALTRAMVSGEREEVAAPQVLNLLDSAAVTLQHLRAAAAKAECSNPEPELWSNRTQRGFWQFVRDGIRLLCCEGVLDAKRNDLLEARECLRIAAKLDGFLATQPTYGPMLRRSSSELEIQRATARIAFLTASRPDTAATFIRQVQGQLPPLPSAANIMQGELALVLNALDNPKQTGLDNVPAGQFFADVAKSDITELWVRYYSQLPDDAEDQNDAERVLIAMNKEAKKTAFYGGYADSYNRMMPTLRDLLARRRLASLAADVLEKRARGESWKEELERTEDPHLGQPMHSVEKGGKLILYSVGRDMHDDGGKDLPPLRSDLRKQPQDYYYDLLFRLPAESLHR